MNAPVGGYDGEVVSRPLIVHRFVILGFRLVKSIWLLDDLGRCTLVCMWQCKAHVLPTFFS